MKLYFNSGLPRSGSTLLQNILCQNPRFHGTATSGLVDVLFSVRNTWTGLVQHKAAPCPDKCRNVLKAIVSAYHQDIKKPVLFDKSRGWLPYIELIEDLLEEQVKILVPVRPVVEILASFEKLYRETSKIKQPPGEKENYFQFQTIQGRCDYWMRPEQPVGIALNRIDDAIKRGFQNRLFFVDFNSLTSKPKDTMQAIYEFLGEEWYEHNFDYVEQITQEDDEVHGFVNLHKIKNKVSPVKNCAEEILGKDVVENIVSRKK